MGTGKQSFNIFFTSNFPERSAPTIFVVVCRDRSYADLPRRHLMLQLLTDFFADRPLFPYGHGPGTSVDHRDDVASLHDNKSPSLARSVVTNRVYSTTHMVNVTQEFDNKFDYFPGIL